MVARRGQSQTPSDRSQYRGEQPSAKRAERERDKQGLKDKGLLGNVGDTLPKL